MEEEWIFGGTGQVMRLHYASYCRICFRFQLLGNRQLLKCGTWKGVAGIQPLCDHSMIWSLLKSTFCTDFSLLNEHLLFREEKVRDYQILHWRITCLVLTTGGGLSTHESRNLGFGGNFKYLDGYRKAVFFWVKSSVSIFLVYYIFDAKECWW